MRRAMRAWIAVAVLGALVLAVWAGVEYPPGNANEVAAARLAPELLRDGEELRRYVAAFPLADYRIAEVEREGRFYIDDSRDLIKRSLSKGVEWEPYITNLILAHAKPGTTVVDVGAHIGTHTVTLAQAAGWRGRVYAFEPQKKIFRELVKNVELNGLRNVVALRFAIGDRHGLVEMNKSGKGNEGGTSIGAGGDRAELRTLDSFGFRNLSFVKIDVEGYEDHVLDGAARTLREQHPVVLVEILGGVDYDKATAEQKRRIEGTRAKIEALGYTTKRVSMHDYLALPRAMP